MGDTAARFSTGIRFLDMEIGGGIPVGDIVALTTPPESQSEALFRELARVQDTHYVSTICADESELEQWVAPPGRESGALSVAYGEPGEVLGDPVALVEEIPPDSCCIVDPVDLLEDGGRGEYLAALDALKDRLRAVGSVGILHGLATESSPANRPLTVKRADHVWQLDRRVDGGEVSTTLLISKSRGNSVPQEAISIELAEQVRIDTSRNIA